MNKKIAHWRGEIDADRVAWLALDKAGASTNSLSRDVMEELDAMVTELAQAQPKALIITSAKRGFIAGADIKEFVGIRTPDQAYELIRQGQQVLDKIAALPCPTIAAINGFALGGGLEVALACRYRVLVDDPSVTLGFPEVQLGVHPGFGGTVRAVHLAGPVAAMDLMLTGRTIRPQQALAMGLVNTVVPLDQLEEETVAWCREMLALSPFALRLSKASFHAHEDGYAGIQQLAHDANLLFYGSDEAREGREAYKAKRKPDFSQFPRRP